MMLNKNTSESLFCLPVQYLIIISHVRHCSLLMLIFLLYSMVRCLPVAQVSAEEVWELRAPVLSTHRVEMILDLKSQSFSCSDVIFDYMHWNTAEPVITSMNGVVGSVTVQIVRSPQSASSEPSAQSSAPSHTPELDTHAPVPHWNWPLGHGSV